jgi:hypothetical protein
MQELQFQLPLHASFDDFMSLYFASNATSRFPSVR